VVLAALAALRYVRGATLPASWKDKVDARLLAEPAGASQDVLIVLTEQADLTAARSRSSKLEKGRYVFERLNEAARRTQAPLCRWLESQGARPEPFWVANMVRAQAGHPLLEALARRSDVARVERNPPMRTRLPIPRTDAAAQTRAAAATQWNLGLLGAPDLWAAGFTGQGIVVGSADTGIEWDHPALKPQYRGWNGTSVNHNYNWHDAVHNAVSGNFCGSNLSAPCDDDGHGTMTLGIAVGDDGATNHVGMAPGARWIGCRNMDEGVGTPARYTECFQWFLAPTNSAGANPDPARAPDVITNSWDCPPAEGCTTPDILRTAVENLRAAGIAIVAAAGNDGPTCATIGVPALYEASITVGATDQSDLLTGYSSRGPGEGTSPKPNVVAPGEGIRSSAVNAGYGILNGTSAAAPHAAGALALLLSASPALLGDVDALQAILEGTAVARTATDTCGGFAAGDVPNDATGYGRIDAAAAFEWVRCPPPAPAIQAPESVAPSTGGSVASAPLRPAHGYAWTLQGGAITGGQGTNQITFSSGAAGTTMTLSVIDSIGACNSPAGAAMVQVDFLDAPPSHIFHQPIVAVARSGITTGCGAGNFCPDGVVTRSQMAVFILRAVKPAGYKPPTATGNSFADVPLGTFLGDWIEAFAAEGYTTGCGGERFCPDDALNRSAAAVFLLRGKHDPAYTPSAATGTAFGDVSTGTFLAAWIENLKADGITGGCGGGNFCPDKSLSRGEMAAFLTRAFSLP
jgi:subtilisin family serine protease